MFIEGKGFVPPKPVLVHIERAEVDMLEPEGHRKAQKYSRSTNAWTRGLRKDAFVIGDIGEYAVYKYLSTKLPAGSLGGWNPRLLSGGDGGVDIPLVGGMSLQVKSGGYNRGELLIDRYRHGKPKPIFKCDAIIWCRVKKIETVLVSPLFGGSDKASSGYDVTIHGYITPKEAISHRRNASRLDASVENLAVPDSHLRPLEDLIDLIKVRRSA